MIRKILILGFLIVIALAQFAVAQDTGVKDTITYGEDGKAYVYPGNAVRVPVYLHTDTPLLGMSANFEYYNATSFMTLDSISKLGSIFYLGNYFDLTGGLLYNQISSDGILPDSMYYGGVALSPSAFLPVGRYKLCDIWLSGGNVGEVLTVDTAFTYPSGTNEFHPASGGYQYYPEFVLGDLMLVEGAPQIFVNVPSPVEAVPGVVVTFEASAFVYYEPTTIALDSLVRQDNGAYPQNEPVTFGTNPLTFTWEPNPYEGNSSWIAYFTITDGTGFSASATVQINVTGGGPYWGVIGDTNCDGIVDIDDAVFLINYIFNGGQVPKCESY